MSMSMSPICIHDPVRFLHMAFFFSFFWLLVPLEGHSNISQPCRYNIINILSHFITFTYVWTCSFMFHVWNWTPSGNVNQPKTSSQKNVISMWERQSGALNYEFLWKTNASDVCPSDDLLLWHTMFQIPSSKFYVSSNKCSFVLIEPI